MKIVVPTTVLGRLVGGVVGRVVCGVVAACGGMTGAAPSLNLEAATADTKAILAAGGQADIILFGDSLSFHDEFSFRPYFTEHLQSLYGDGGKGYIGVATDRGRFGAGWTAGMVAPGDPAPHHALDGLWLKAMADCAAPSGGVITAFWDRMELHYIAEPGGGQVKLTGAYDGNPIVRLDTNADTPQVRTFSVEFPAGTPSAVHYQPDGTGPVTLLGMNLVHRQPGVRVHRASNGGWGTAHYLRRDFSFDQQLQLLGTDLVMVGVGVNDAYRTREDFVNQLNLLGDRIEAAVPDAEVLLVTPHNYGTPEAPVVAGAIEEVAAARGYGLINLYEAAGSYELFQSNGYLSDDVHFSPSGGEYVGNMLFEAFRTNGASLPEPASLTVVGAAAFLLLGRRRL